MSGDMGDTSPDPLGGEAVPWQETNPVLERHHFAQDLASGAWTMTELCLRYGVSRNTGYKWLDGDPRTARARERRRCIPDGSSPSRCRPRVDGEANPSGALGCGEASWQLGRGNDRLGTAAAIASANALRLGWSSGKTSR